MTIARGVAIAALALAIVLVALLLVRGANTHEYDLLFQNAGQLVKGDDVQVGGRRIGSVREITLTDDNRARVHIRVEEPFAPLRDGTHAVIRLTSLSGIANRFIALTPAPNSAKQLDDGATLAAGSTTGVVDLDQLFNTLDPKARRDLQGVIQGFATQYNGRGKEAGETAEYFNPFLSTSRQLVNQLTAGRGHADRLHRQLVARRDRDRREARRPRLAGREHEHDGGGDRLRRTPRSSRRWGCCRPRCGAPTRRSSTCGRRSTTSTRWSTRPSRRPRSSRRSCASCARWSRARSRRSTTCAAWSRPRARTTT